MTIELVEITDDNAQSVRALRLAPGQERFVSPVADSLQEAQEHPQGNAWLGPRARTERRSASSCSAPWRRDRAPDGEVVLRLDLRRQG